jgi:hypothetical protein
MPQFKCSVEDDVPAARRLRRIHVPDDQQPRDFLVVAWSQSHGDVELVEVPRFRTFRRLRSQR